MIFNIENLATDNFESLKKQYLVEISQISFNILLEVWFCRRAADLPDVKNWKSNEERK